MAWEKVGEVDVDAGLIWVGDPCYCVTPDADSHPAKTWEEFCKKLQGNEQDGVCRWPHHGPANAEGLGVSVSSGYGDGTYPVYVKRFRDGRIKAVMVDFGDDGDEEMEDEG